MIEDNMPLSTMDFNPCEHIASQMLLTSKAAISNGLFLRHFAHQPRQALSVPPMLEDVVLVALDGSTDLHGKVARRFPNYRATPEDVFIIPRGEPCEWEWNEAHHVLQVSIDRSLPATVAREAGDIDVHAVELIPRIMLRDPLISQLCLALLAGLQSGGRFNSLYVESLTHTLVVHLLRNHAVFPQPMPMPKSRLTGPTLQRALDYIDDHLAHDLTLDEIAGLTQISAYHFARLFKQALGKPPHRYVTERRLDAAKRLLLAGGYTIADIAVKTGFADQSHLNRQFKRHFGVTPHALVGQSKNIQQNRKNIQDFSTEID
jgi:AraC family transcriptional regulator